MGLRVNAKQSHHIVILWGRASLYALEKPLATEGGGSKYGYPHIRVDIMQRLRW
jgi:hypothetical protein